MSSSPVISRRRSSTADDSVSYDVDGFDGRSIQRIEITEPGQYTVEVVGDDLTVVGALGRDPDDGVDDLRQTALVVAIGGIALGLLLLFAVGPSFEAAPTVTGPARGPGLGHDPPAGNGGLDARGPRGRGRCPVNPHAPPEPASVDADAPHPGRRSWLPPSGAAADDVDEPDPTAPPAACHRRRRSRPAAPPMLPGARRET